MRREQVDWQRNGDTVEEEGYSTDLLAQEAMNLLRDNAAYQPFYMQVAFNAPHIPLAAPPELVEKHGGLYPAVIDAMDRAIGDILTELDRQELSKDTLVVFFSDNGADVRYGDNSPFRSGKKTLYEGGIRTPCIFRWPDRISSGGVLEQPFSVHDFFPTLASAAGIALPKEAQIDGTNQWPVIQSGENRERDPFLIATSDIAMIDGNWKLIESGNGTVELFDLSRDPSEANDLARVETERVQSLTSKLHQLKADLPAATQPSKGVRKEKGKKGKSKG